MNELSSVIRLKVLKSRILKRKQLEMSSNLIGKRFLGFLKSVGETSNSLSKKIGVSPSATKQIEKGDNLPSAKVLIPLAEKYPALNLRWLLLGEGDMWLTYSGIDSIWLIDEPEMFLSPDLADRLQKSKFGDLDEKQLKEKLTKLSVQVGILKNKLIEREKQMEEKDQRIKDKETIIKDKEVIIEMLKKS